MQWTEDDLCKFLKEAGWCDTAVVEYPTKRIRPWLVRCRSPFVVLANVAAVRCGNVFLSLEEAIPRSSRVSLRSCPFIGLLFPVCLERSPSILLCMSVLKTLLRLLPWMLPWRKVRRKSYNCVAAGWTTAGQSDFDTSPVALRGAGAKSVCSDLGKWLPPSAPRSGSCGPVGGSERLPAKPPILEKFGLINVLFWLLNRVSFQLFPSGWG